MTLCAICGAIVDATVPCYDGARRCLPCAAQDGFEWRADDHAATDLYPAAPWEASDSPATPRRLRRGVPAHRTQIRRTPRAKCS
jgi:hypothetical protein